ncbi:MAG: hypothetical protein KBA03_02090 [Anaerolineaceae bacterium]|nr:hypothetical protein [Anaerolineaceae bacterium]
MSRNNKFLVPDYLSSNEDLEGWIEKTIDEQGDDFNLWQEFELSEAIFRFLAHNRLQLFTPETIDYYKRQYVYSLMDNGLDAKRGGGAMLQRAQDYFGTALRIIKENPLASFRLGILYYSRDRAKAMGYFARALELSRLNDGILEKLKLNTSQVDYAIEQVSKLLREINSESRLEPLIFSNEELRQQINERIVYSFKDCTEPESPEKTISIGEYDELLWELKNDSNALVIDRFNFNRPYISYMRSGPRYLSEDDSNLKHLLSSLNLEIYPDPLGSIDVYRQNSSRLNRVLREIGVLSEKFRTSTSGNGPKQIFAISNLKVHYFRTIIH